MLQAGLRRRTLLAAAPLVLGAKLQATDSAPIAWYVGRATDRTDPFVTWACEAMQASSGLRVGRSLDIATADVVCTTRAEADAFGLRLIRPIAWRGGHAVASVSPWARPGPGPAQFIAFLASQAATVRAMDLASQAAVVQSTLADTGGSSMEGRPVRNRQ